MKNFYVKLLFVLFLFVANPHFVAAYQFTKDLKVGDSNSDVLELQKVLNSASSTVIALSGPGSAGSETNYFGNLTKLAVIRLQENNKNEILIPNGLLKGTGFVGASTRKKLNSLNGSNVSKVVEKINTNTIVKPADKTNSFFNQVNPEEKNTVNSYLKSLIGKTVDQISLPLDLTGNKSVLDTLPSFLKKVTVYNVEPYQIKPGQKVVVNGLGFTEKDNTFSFGGSRLSGVSCSYSTYCEVLIPKDVSLGEQSVELSNSNGNSSNQGFPVKIFATNNPISPPSILSVIPGSIKESDIGMNIIIKGERFTSTENYVYTPLGRVGPYSSDDGKTILFSLKGMKDIDKFIERGKLLKTDSIALPLRVDNEQGVGNSSFINLIFTKK